MPPIFRMADLMEASPERFPILGSLISFVMRPGVDEACPYIIWTHLAQTPNDRVLYSSMLRTWRVASQAGVLLHEIQKRIVDFVGPTTNVFFVKVQPRQPPLWYYDTQGDHHSITTLMLPSLDRTTAERFHNLMLFSEDLASPDGLDEFLTSVDDHVFLLHPAIRLHVDLVLQRGAAICDWRALA